MTTELGHKPSERDPNAQARARAREDAPPAGDEGAQFRWAQALAPRVFSGAMSRESLWHADPPPLNLVWEHHVRSATYFQAGLLRWPRYVWGWLHMVITAVLYLIIWATDSPPKAAVTAVVIGSGFWFHVL